jgi:hypothetical protein
MPVLCGIGGPVLAKAVLMLLAAGSVAAIIYGLVIAGRKGKHSDKSHKNEGKNLCLHNKDLRKCNIR